MSEDSRAAGAADSAVALRSAIARLESQLGQSEGRDVARCDPAAWEDLIARNALDEPVFENLPAVRNLISRESWSINPAALNLPYPIDHYIERDIAPIPIPDDRVGYYGHRHFEYWLSGLQHHQIVVELMQTYNVERRAILDFGSASGRAIRHMAAYETFQELWAIDLNWRHIAWIQRYLPRSIRSVHNTSIPHLPIEDGSMDCVMAWSVFSHIGSFETAWLAEIRRVLKPKGLALITCVTEGQIASMKPHWPMYAAFVEHPRWHDGFAAELKERGKITLRIGTGSAYSSNVIYDTDYLQSSWGRLFNVLEHKREYPIFQDLLVLQKP